MLPAVRPQRSLSMARGYTRIDSRPIQQNGLSWSPEVHRARLPVIIGVRTFPHGLDPSATLAVHCGNSFDTGFSPYQSIPLIR